MKKITKKDLYKLLEAVLKVRGGRGYSVGHPYKEFQGKQVYGQSDHHYEHIKDEEELKDSDPVEISRAFKGVENVRN